MYDLCTHSFIVKIWLEESLPEAGRAIWRGRITHVPSRKTALGHELEQILRFIAPYLEEMGVDVCPPGGAGPREAG